MLGVQLMRCGIWRREHKVDGSKWGMDGIVV